MLAATLTHINTSAPWLIPLWGAVFGAVFGSFISCARTRIPAGQSLRYPPSQCDNCQRRLTFVDLIPIFSHLFLGGKCRTCGAQIGAISLIIEVLCAGLGASVLFCITRLL